MSKLLTEQELIQKVTVLTIDCGVKSVSPEYLTLLVGLIQSQKLAHADIVIGEDNDITKIAQERYPFPYDAMEPRLKSENNLMTKQRERNKL